MIRHNHGLLPLKSAKAVSVLAGNRSTLETQSPARLRSRTQPDHFCSRTIDDFLHWLCRRKPRGSVYRTHRRLRCMNWILSVSLSIHVSSTKSARIFFYTSLLSLIYRAQKLFLPSLALDVPFTQGSQTYTNRFVLSVHHRVYRNNIMLFSIIYLSLID